MPYNTQATMLRDKQGYNMFGLPFCDFNHKFKVNLDQDISASITTPNDANLWRVVFRISPGSTVWVAQNDTAEYPITNSFTNTSSEMNPVCCEAKPGDIFDFITADTNAFVEIIFYAYE
jgi:hypothetical protein